MSDQPELPEVEEEPTVSPVEQRRSFAVNAAVQLGIAGGQTDIGSILDASKKIEDYLTSSGLPQTD